MKISLQTKLLALCIFLVLLTAVSISASYYTLTKKDKQRESRQRIQVAFDIIGDDMLNRTQDYSAKIEEFLQQAKNIPRTLTFYLHKEDEQKFFEILTNMSHLIKSGVELQRFSQLIAADHLAIYSHDRRLLVSYQQGQNQEGTEVYVLSGITKAGQSTYISTLDYNQFLLQPEELPEVPLAADITAEFLGDFPEGLVTEYFQSDRQFGLRIMAPVIQRDERVGVLMGEMYINQSMVERYASLSHTDVNLFAGNQWSVGTLPSQAELESGGLEQYAACDDLFRTEAHIDVSLETVREQAYYQGGCAFKNSAGESIGAITVSLSQEIEQQEIAKLLRSVFIVASVVSLFAMAFSLLASRKSVRFIQQLILYIDRIAQGDIPEKITSSYKGEFQEIQRNVNSLIDAMSKVTHVAEEIANGDLSVDVQKRSRNDKLMQALQSMLNSLREVTQVAGEISEGNLAIDVAKRSDKDAMMQALQAMVASLRDVAQLAEEIGNGNLAVDVNQRSDKDMLMQALQTMIGSLRDVSRIADEIAEGNLTVEVNTRSENDVLMQALHKMMQRLQDIVLSVQSSADNVAAGSREMRGSSEKMSQGATLQAASTEEVSASMQEMAANISQNADNATQTEKLALQAAQDAKKSGESVAEMVTAIQDIAEKIAIIEDIASQTRMLSLNATIESSRAQEYGKAFSVVASEVRNLSDITRNAAADISKAASSSVAIAQQSRELLDNLVPSIEKTANLVQEISAASNEQRTGALQINHAVQQLDQVTQQNAVTSESVASTAEELSAQAEQLRASMQFFNMRERTEHLEWEEKPEISEVYFEARSFERASRPRAERPSPHQESEGKQPPKRDTSNRFMELEAQAGAKDERDDEFERF